jgi:hypothetical protein
MIILCPTFYSRIKKSHIKNKMSIIIAGCGCGYDIFGVIPLYSEQKERKKI